jgi:dihydroxy-acid dehydratase
VGGPIACVEDGDEISFDLLEGVIHVAVSAETLAARKAKLPAWNGLRTMRGYLADWSATVAQASHGCVSLALHPQCR